MKKNLLTLFVLSALLLIPNAGKATVLLNEHFNQATSTLATNDNAFGTEIAATGWTNISGSNAIYMNNADLTYSGYKSATDGTRCIETMSTSGVKKVACPLSEVVSSGSVFMAAIVNLKNYSTTSQTSSTRDYLFSMCNGTSSVSTATNCYGRLTMQKIAANQFQFGVAKNTENLANISYTGTLEYENTFLVVLEYEFVAGDNNDIVRLYLNPTKGDKPGATITTNAVSADALADAAQLKSIIINASSYFKASMLIDEIKVATSWADLWESGSTPDPDPDPDPEPEPIAKPEPEESDVTVNSATISWDAVTGADSYVLQWKIDGGSYSEDIEIDEGESYALSGLAENTKYYVRVKTIIGEDASDWAEINFTTQPEPDVLVYKEISFDKYSTQDAMPTSGQVFLAKNVVEYNDVTLTGNLTLNLHGKQIFLYGTHIIVPSGKTLTIYDDAGEGVITGGYPGDFLDKALISVKDGGTLIIGEGAIINLSDGTNDYNAAIDNASGGTVKISGAPNISGVKTDIYLNSNAITIESGKPLTNTTPYKVFRLSGVFTAGWANMGGEKPGDYFVSSASNRGVCLGASGEGQIVSAFTLSENSNNSDIATYSGELSNISFVRSLVSSQYNSFCLPFALSAAQMEEFFGAGYDLEEFVSSELDGDVLSLTFNKVTTGLEAGKPYLLQPSIDVVNPSFEGVTITATSPADQTSDTYISFHATYAPTELEGGNKNLLFLGSGNELFYPSTTANIKAFRAYFEVKGDARKAAKRARIVKKEDSATGIDQITNDKLPMTNKIIKDNQLLILRDGKTYNVLGMECK